MRGSLAIAILLVLGLGRQPLQAEELMAQIPSQTDLSDNFWSRAQQLTQEQVNLVNRIEEAIASPDPNQVRTVRGQIVLHLSSVDRFLKSQYPLPNVLCSPTFQATPSVTESNEALIFATSRLSPEQRSVFCALFGSTQQLSPLLPQLDRRLGALTDVAQLRPLPLGGERRIESVNSVAAQPLTPLTPSPATSSGTPPAPVPLVGRPAKTAVSGYVAPPPPAIAPPAEIASRLQATRQLTDRAQGLFPVGTSFFNPAEVRSPLREEASPRVIQASSAYSQVLSLPNTGIATIRPAEFYVSRPGELRNRLIPTPAERTPLAPLTSPVVQATRPQTPSVGLSTPTRLESTSASPESEPEGFAPRLAVQITNGQFQVIPRALNYGFMVNLGDVPLEQLNATLGTNQANLSPQLRSFFLNYRPPEELEALQVDQRRFLTGKIAGLGLQEAISAQAPVMLNQTYLMRLIQFDLPDAVLAGQQIARSDRANLDRLLETPSSDLLVAFRPIAQGPDGSYTTVWRILAPFPDPQISNLEAYILPAN